MFFPFILLVFAKNKQNNTLVFDSQQELPFVSIVIAAYNEEQVIEQKILSIFNTNYPESRFNVHIGSDNSTDATNLIIQKYVEKHPNLFLHAFTERQGKSQIINKLCGDSQCEIIILTDANVYFEPNTIFELIKHYKNQEIALVGGLIINTNVKKTGISYQEKTYLSLENRLKYREGILWGAMIGAFGGVYSIRKNMYHPVPKNYFMDDFYITMSVLQEGKRAILEPEALCFEDISNIIREEFRRKIRISIGNFQNLATFWKMAINPFSGKGFSFLSHKILRWFTPFFLIISLITSAILCFFNPFYTLLLGIQAILLLIPMIDIILKSGNIHLRIFRFITHFYTMNLALLIGFFKYLKGINSNVWQPTKRNQI